MARGGRRGNPYRDANGRFASASTGRSGLSASRSKSSPAAARKAARSQSGRASTLAARSSLKRSRSKLAGRDPADQRLSSTLSGRAQKAAVTRGNRKLTAAKGAAKTKLQGTTAVGTIGRNRPKLVVATARPIDQSARIPAAQRPGSMTNILGGTLKALAQADAQRIREIEAITGQKVRAPRKSAGTPSVATVRPPGRRSVSGTLGDNLRQLAQSDARMMRGMAEIARDATPKIGGGRKKAVKGASKALPQGGGAEKPKPPSRAKGSRTRLPGMAGVVDKPKGLKPRALAERPPRVIGKPLGGESKRITSTPIKRSGAMKPPITLSRLKEIGGNRWQKNNMDRVYFNNLADRAGMDYSKYKSSGRVSTAALKGKGISNSKAQEIIANLNAGKVYFDRKTRKMVAQGPSMSYGRSRQQTTAKGLLDEVARKLERQGRIRTIKRANQKRKKSK